MLHKFLAHQKENNAIWLASMLAFGIAVYFSLPYEPSVSVSISVTVLLGLSFLFFRTLPSVLKIALLLVFLFALGFSAGSMRTAYKNTVLLKKEVRYTTLTGTVETLEKRPSGLRLVVQPDEIDHLDKKQDLPTRLQITTRHMKDVEWRDLPGKRIFLTASLIAPSPPVIPGAYDFARHAYFKGIGGYGYTVGESRILDAEDSQTLILPWMRADLTQSVFAHMDQQTGGIAATLFTGSRGGVTDKAYDAFKAAGLAHLLSISGMHVGMVAGFLFYVARLIMAGIPALSLRYPIKKWAAGFALAGAFAYTLMVGAPVPTQRAFMMTAIALLAIMVDRSPLSMRLVAVAAIVLLLFQPESLLGPSFQMSFAAVVALIAFYDATREFWRKQWREGGRFFYKRILIYLYGVLATTIIATIATSLFAVFHFGQLAPYSIPGNLVAMPIMALFVMPFVVLTYFLVPFGIEFLSLWVIDQALSAILFIAIQIDAIPYALYPVPYMSVPVLLWFVAGGMILCFIKGRERYVGFIPVLIGSVLYAMSPMPDIIVTKGMSIIGVAQEGRMAYIERKSDSFSRGLVSAMTGDKADRVVAEKDSRCDMWGCVFRHKNKTIAIPLTAEALKEDCQSADIVISREAIKGACQAFTIDWWDVWGGGGVSGYIQHGRVHFEYVQDQRRNRPWIQ